MKRTLTLLLSVLCVSLVALISNTTLTKSGVTGTVKSSFQTLSEEKNPWTRLQPNGSSEQFQFAVISDRTGGHRKGIFSRAVQQINLLQPDFVMSVGDLIEGQTTPEGNAKQWDEFDGYVKRLDMPFFYAPGNHDSQSLVKANVWKERLGRRYYHFLHKNCLFLVLNAYDEDQDDPTNDASYKKTRIGKKQRAYIQETLQKNPNVRWTFVFIHPPIWSEKDLTTNGWREVEDLLRSRNHNVYAGHLHTYRKYLRNGTAYYQLATTGGGSSLRGLEYGEFDQVAWITMKTDAPVMANILLTGVQNDSLTPFPSEEDGADQQTVKGIYPVTGTVLLEGKPAVGTLVTFTEILDLPPPQGKSAVVGSARVGDDGSFIMAVRRGALGLKPGRWTVTFEPAPPVVVDPMVVPKNPIPARYRKLSTTPYQVEVVPDQTNRFEFLLVNS
jgi:serine/threonine-protein phosphatase CPPED1